MDKITVGDLATECSVKNNVVLSELKRLGLYVFSSTATIDGSFAETIRKKILAQREAEEAKLAEAEKKKETEAAKKEAAKAAGKKAKKTPGKPHARKKAAATAEKAAPKPRAARKGKKAAAKAAVPVEEEVLPKPSLKPRKGRKHYDREKEELVEASAKPPEAPPAPVSPEAAPEPPPLEVVPSIEVEAPAEEAPPVTTEPVVEPEAPPEPPAEPVVEQPAARLEPIVTGAPPEIGVEAPTAAAEAGPPKAAPGDKISSPEIPPQPGKVSKKIVIRKAKSKILMRTATEKVVTPEVSVRILRGIREGKPTFARGVATRHPKRRRTAKTAAPAKVAKVVELPRPPVSPEDFRPMAITEGVTLKELAEKMEIKSKFIIQKLLSKGILASVNQALDVEVAKEICAEFGFRAEVISFEEEVEVRQEAKDQPEDKVTRYPVVTVMGHVDHGKTSLLDAIRETNVTETEAGGITQHIGAYQVEVGERSIVFLDTPGHEAFTLMRARGAHVTDIVVLVVAADDGVMPQTVEAIDHAKAAGVPILVAINKIDKPAAQLDRVKQDLSERGLLAEDWGGDVVTVPVSAKEKTNLDLLLEMILLVADMKDFKANPKRLAGGVVLEAQVDRGRGCVATVLVQNGTLKLGDTIVAGAVQGRVRALINDRGENIDLAGPSIPVEIQGLHDLPLAGDSFQVFEDTAKARQVVGYRQGKLREKAMRNTARLSLQALYQRMSEGTIKELPLIVKGDVQGSVEVLAEVLNKLGTEKAKVNILRSGAGAVSETDVMLASASNAIIIGFCVRPGRKAMELADSEGVEIRTYTVIYNVANDIKNAMIGMLDHTTQEKYLGRAEVRDTFKVPKFGFIAGSYILDGVIQRSAEIRLLRDNVVIHEGKIGSLRRFKDDVSEVRSGYECGIGFESFNDIKKGDVIEAYTLEKVQPTTL